jgi:hypothetical protein
MKLSFLIVASAFYACSDDWNAHYAQEKQIVDNDNVTIVNLPAIEYLKSEESLSSMYNLFEETGIISEMNEKDQLFTIFVIRNDAATVSTDDKQYLAKSHIADVALSPANLSDGLRVMVWNGKYLNVTKIKNDEKEYDITFNGKKVLKITQAQNAYIYELESFIDSPKSLYEIISGLDEDYSIFREMILSRNENTFNKAASLPIGVDHTGNVVYDSVFTVSNPYFAAKGFDLMSESLTATLLIPSNEVVTQALNTAHNYLQNVGLERADSVLANWIFQSVFFNKKYAKGDFAKNTDLTSIFSKQWRTTVQEVDLDNPISMSNGVAYYVNYMRIPTNVLIYRIKDYMKWYEFLNDEQKAEYFVTDNLTFDKLNTDVTEWSGWPAGGFPMIENRILMYNLTEPETKEFTLDFQPIQCKSNGDGTYTVTRYSIPPGEYDLCLGFKQYKSGTSPGDIQISFNGEYIGTVTAADLATTTFHYDRGGQGYPEGYDVNKATDSKKSNYDRDGGKIGVITIGGNEAIPISITFKGVAVENGKTCFHHWCLRPTSNCY